MALCCTAQPYRPLLAWLLKLRGIAAPPEHIQSECGYVCGRVGGGREAMGSLLWLGTPGGDAEVCVCLCA
jgi:hypothetical protein